jgi:hypothetical protein
MFWVLPEQVGRVVAVHDGDQAVVGTPDLVALVHAWRLRPTPNSHSHLRAIGALVVLAPPGSSDPNKGRAMHGRTVQ